MDACEVDFLRCFIWLSRQSVILHLISTRTMLSAGATMNLLCIALAWSSWASLNHLGARHCLDCLGFRRLLGYWGTLEESLGIGLERSS